VTKSKNKKMVDETVSIKHLFSFTIAFFSQFRFIAFSDRSIMFSVLSKAKRNTRASELRIE